MNHARTHQQIRRVNLPDNAGAVVRRHLGTWLAHINPGPALQQQLHHLEVAVPRRHLAAADESSVIVMTPPCYIPAETPNAGTGGVQQNDSFLNGCCHHQRRDTVRVGHVGLRAGQVATGVGLQLQ